MVPQRDERRRKANCLSLGGGGGSADWVPCHPGVTRSPTCVCDAPSHAPMGIPRSMQMRRPGDDRSIDRSNHPAGGSSSDRGPAAAGTRDLRGGHAGHGWPTSQSTGRPVDRSADRHEARPFVRLLPSACYASAPSLDGREETITRVTLTIFLYHHVCHISP